MNTDKLIKGRRSLRVECLEGLEMMTVQLEEAKGFIERDTVVHARLAFILLDNAAEVLMRRNVETILSGNRMLEGILSQWKEILTQTDDPEARRHHDEVEQKVISKRKRIQLANLFPVKVNFIREHGGITTTEARVLNKLHQYRNELYHRDHIRLNIIQSACLFYFDVVCSLFEKLEQYDLVPVTLMMTAPPVLQKYNPAGTTRGYPSEEMIAQHLRSGLGLDDASLAEALFIHLTSRLDELEQNIDRANRMLFGDIPSLIPSGPWMDCVVRIAQTHEEGPPDTLEQLLGKDLKYRVGDLAEWRQAVAALQAIDEKLGLFAAFADIEDAFEEFEEQVKDLMERLDHEEQMRWDIERGK